MLAENFILLSRRSIAMKRLAFLSFTIATLIAPIQVQAQQYPVTIQQPEDCSLGLIKFEAALTGLADIVVTPDVQQIWRAHLDNIYSTLSPAYQIEYGPQACDKLSWLMRNFSQLPLSERELYMRAWAESLPAAFQLLVNPVFSFAAQQAQQAQQNASCFAGNPEAELHYLLANPNGHLCGSPNPHPGGVTETLSKGLTDSANSTIGLMGAMSGRGR
jgi:hypothetical protein